MGRRKGSKNKFKSKKNEFQRFKSKKKGNFMANINDVLLAVNNLNTAVDTLITNLGNAKITDTQPAIDAINAITAKIQGIQLPTA